MLFRSTLITRRDKVLKTWLTAVNPLVDPRLDANGALTFENAAVTARVASPPSSYRMTWSRFDNTAGPIGSGVEVQASEPKTLAPQGVLEGADFVSVSVRTVHPDHSNWLNPVTFYFRRVADGWQPVGLDRSPR